MCCLICCLCRQTISCLCRQWICCLSRIKIWRMDSQQTCCPHDQYIWCLYKQGICCLFVQTTNLLVAQTMNLLCFFFVSKPLAPRPIGPNAPLLAPIRVCLFLKTQVRTTTSVMRMETASAVLTFIALPGGSLAAPLN